MSISIVRQGRQPSDRKGAVAEDSEECLLFRFWAVREDRTDCHNTLWSAIDDDRIVSVLSDFPWTAYKAVHFYDPHRRGGTAGERQRGKEEL